MVVLACVEKKTGDELKTEPLSGNSRLSGQSSTGNKIPAGARGVWHKVEPGQNLWRICKTYGVDMEEVARLNGISDPRQISVGQKIFIPGAVSLKTVEPYQPPGGDSAGPSMPKPGPQPPEPLPPDTPSRSSGRLLWPVDGGQIFSDFGTRSGKFHEGIDISAKPGTAIFAAADGRVVYADDKIRGYGNMIVIKHAGNLSTVYAHNRVNLVKEGDFVRQGDKIAELGQSGNASGPHLHFEVRVGKEAVDPMKYLEKRN